MRQLCNFFSLLLFWVLIGLIQERQVGLEVDKVKTEDLAIARNRLSEEIGVDYSLFIDFKKARESVH